ncbi:MAG: hypothetical protein HYW47_03615 [Deltaproteobacteria bacterium]|nr:hypothetical protein [Deltaproteobacteria bacterium]
MKKAKKIKLDVFLGILFLSLFGIHCAYSEEVRFVQKPQKTPQSVFTHMNKKLIPVKDYTQDLIKNSLKTTSFSMLDCWNDEKTKETSSNGYGMIQDKFIKLLRKNFEDNIKLSVTSFFFGKNHNIVSTNKNKKPNNDASPLISSFKPKLHLSKDSFKIGAEKIFLNGTQSLTSFNSDAMKLETSFTKPVDKDTYLNLKASKEFSNTKATEIQIGINFKF